jgi:hypothetical protein
MALFFFLHHIRSADDDKRGMLLLFLLLRLIGVDEVDDSYAADKQPSIQSALAYICIT